MEYQNEEERKLFNPRSSSEIKAEMNKKGFTSVGSESLTRFKFTKEAKFEVEVFRTKEDVAKEYVDRFGDGVEVVLVEEEGLSQKQQAVFVFAKKKY